MAIETRIVKGSVRRALDQIGDRWTLLILLSAFCGLQRFEEWKNLYGVSPSILSSRLKRLVENGIMEKRPIEAGSRRLRYVLSDKGSDLFLWALAVWSWERTWVYRDSEHPVRLLHRGCGHAVAPLFVCGHCSKRVGHDNVIIEHGPGYEKVPIPETPASRRSGSGSGNDTDLQHIGRSVDIIGDRWSFLVISAAYFGVTRFDDFQSELRIATNILSDRLRHLADHGMLARNRYQERPPRYEYILTEKNIAFYDVPLMLALWGDKWLPVEAGPPFLRYHEICGERLDVRPICDHCGDELRREDVDFSGAEAAGAKTDAS